MVTSQPQKASDGVGGGDDGSPSGRIRSKTGATPPRPPPPPIKKRKTRTPPSQGVKNVLPKKVSPHEDGDDDDSPPTPKKPRITNAQKLANLVSLHNLFACD